jgi:hypothetical protein
VDGVLVANGDVASTIGGGAGEGRRCDRTDAIGDGANELDALGLRGSKDISKSCSVLASYPGGANRLTDEVKLKFANWLINASALLKAAVTDADTGNVCRGLEP